MLFWLLACTKSPLPVDSAAPCAGAFAVVSTASDDYSVGALATVCLDDLSVADSLAAVTGDTVVVVDGGAVWALNRSNQNSLRRYAPEDLRVPLWEVSTGEASNPQDLAICGGEAWVSRYESNRLLRLNPEDGSTLGETDLSAYADEDGLAELNDLVAIGDTLYVTAQQLNRDHAYQAEGGLILALDCGSGEVTGSWSPGPNPTIELLGDARLLVRTGVYFDADGAFLYDGGVRLLDTEAGELGQPLITEQELGKNLGGAAAAGEHLVTIAADEAWGYEIGCVPLIGGIYTPAMSSSSFLSAIRGNRRGEVWVASRASWAAPEAPGALIVIDAVSCAVASDAVTTTLDPLDLAFYEP